MHKKLVKQLLNLNKTAIFEDEKEISFKALISFALRFKNKLNKFESKVVCLYLENSINFVVAFVAGFLSKKVIMPLNPKAKVNEFAEIINKTKTKVVITTSVLSKTFEGFKTQSGENLKTIKIDEEVFNENEKQSENFKLNLNKLKMLVPTSGTTSSSKIVQLTARNMLASATAFSNRLEKSNENKFLIVTPYFTAYGIMVLLSCLIQKTSFVVYNEDFSANKIFKKIEKFKITHYGGAPMIATWLNLIKNKKIKFDISSLKYVAFGGSKVSQETMKNIYKAFPKIWFYQGYGLSEASPLVAKPFAFGKEKIVYKNEKLASVGQVVDFAKVFIKTDKNKLTKLPFITGEIVVKGKNVMHGCYKDNLNTKKVLKNNKLYTGDLGYFDEEGYLYIVGRIKNIIIVRGFNVYPEEVESAIMKFGNVEECLVFGKKHNDNEIVVANLIVKKNFNKEKLIEFLKVSLSNYKIPTQINIIEKLEKNHSGKVKRNV